MGKTGSGCMGYGVGWLCTRTHVSAGTHVLVSAGTHVLVSAGMHVLVSAGTYVLVSAKYNLIIADMSLGGYTCMMVLVR